MGENTKAGQFSPEEFHAVTEGMVTELSGKTLNEATQYLDTLPPLMYDRLMNDLARRDLDLQDQIDAAKNPYDQAGLERKKHQLGRLIEFVVFAHKRSKASSKMGRERQT